jgi:hypothetical protein
MHFIGVLDEYEAEAEHGEVGNTAAEAYSQLHERLEEHGLFSEIPFSLEIDWEKESHVDVSALAVAPAEVSNRPASVFASCMAPFAGYPAEKLEAIEAECHAREAASAKITPAEEEAHKAEMRATRQTRRTAVEAAERGSPVPARTSELSSDREGPLGTSQSFVSTGNWTGEVDGQWYQVFAGSAVAPSTGAGERAELRVYSLPTTPQSDEAPMFVGSYTPPGDEREPLTIRAANADVLEVVTSTGTVLPFNLATRSF